MSFPEHLKFEGIEKKRFWLGVVIPSVLLYLTFVSPPMQLKPEFQLKDALKGSNPTSRARASVQNVSAPVAPIPPAPATPVATAQASGSASNVPQALAIPTPATPSPVPQAAGPAATAPQAQVAGSQPSGSLFYPQAELLKAQHQKCVEEIKMRLEQEETWIHHKFVFLGAILAGFLYRTLFPASSEKPRPAVVLRDVFGSPWFVIVLALCCGVCIIADMHIRANRVVINENGAWIAAYVEPAFFGGDYATNQANLSKFIGWEKFLRLQGGYHKDQLFHLFFWPEIFLVSVGVYSAFAYVFFWQIQRNYREERDCGNYLEGKLRFGCYLILHAQILICAVSTHYVPGTFLLAPWWAFGDAVSAKWAACVYGLLGLSLCACSAVALGSEIDEARQQRKAEQKRRDRTIEASMIQRKLQERGLPIPSREAIAERAHILGEQRRQNSMPGTEIDDWEGAEFDLLSEASQQACQPAPRPLA
ncbi:MAG TPA: hypothetical protein VGO11_12925 [Chthoniobacteraceae bacterium]|nr:hypothetical protein [Chthoniobacteraceae bacterium]